MAITLVKEAGIAYINLNKPPANTYNLDLMRELDNAINEIRQDDRIIAVILRSEVPKMFSAGADIQMLKASDPTYKAAFCLFCQETLNKLERTPKIFIAALEGNCVGGGLEIALACDFRFMADGNWKIGLPESNLGVLPGTGGSQRLPRLIGKARALDLMITGRLLSPQEALHIGLVEYVWPQEELMERTIEYARNLTRRAIRTVGLIKLDVNQGLEMPLEAALTLERELQNRLFVTHDAQEGLAAFIEKRQPQFEGR